MGGLFAASTTIPKGSFAKVTNLANNKSIVVQINDYGPQGKGRIIDLDKVAFQKIASIGAGVVGVKVEEVLN
jgi:rare lipoprotein A